LKVDSHLDCEALYRLGIIPNSFFNLFMNEEKIKSERTEVQKTCYAGLDGNSTLFLEFKTAFVLFYEKYLGHYAKKGVQTEFIKKLW